MYDVEKLRFWCQKILPLVYEDSLSFYELLCKVVYKLNELVENVNDIPEYIGQLISEEGLQEIMKTLLVNLESQIANANEGKSETATDDRAVGTLVWLNGYLYRATKYIDAGDRYVVDGNVEKITVEEVIKGVMLALTDNYEDGERVASEDREAGELVWFKNQLLYIKEDITEGNAYTDLNSEVVDFSKLFVNIHNQILAEAEARDNADTEIENKIGDLNELETSAKSNVVNAINSVVSDIDDVDDKIGDLSELETSVTTDVVKAVNSLKSEIESEIGDLSELDTSDKSSVVNSVNSVYAKVQAVENFILNPKFFGAVCDKNVDDSVAVQAMFDFALSHKMTKVNFNDITEISFANVEIKSNVEIDFGKCKFYGVGGTDERVLTMFTANDSAIDIVINGGEFIGKGDDIAYNNPTTEQNAPLIDITTANKVIIDGGYYHNINNTTEGVLGTTPMSDRCGALFRIHDTNFVAINHNTIDKCYGSELIFVINDNYARKDINGEFKYNYIGETSTTAFDFIGGNVEVCGNSYNYDYVGSAINAFGLNVLTHDEYVNGYFYNVYDTCEGTYFQNDNVVIKNIIAKETSYFARVASRNTEISNIIILQVGEHVTVIGHLQAGYGGNTDVHPDVGTHELTNCTFTIKNCDCTNLNGDAFMFLCSLSLSNPPVVNIDSCVTPKITTSSRKTSLVVANYCVVKITNCVIFSRYNVGFSSDIAVGLFLQSDIIPRRVTISNCTFYANNLDNMSESYLVASASSNYNTGVVLIGNDVVSNVTSHLLPTAHTAHSEAGNYGFS